MKTPLLLLGTALMLSACSASSEWVLGEPQCRQIGCGDGLVFYPNEEGAAQDGIRRMYNFEWGETSSAYAPSDPKHQELYQQELQQGNTVYHWNNQ